MKLISINIEHGVHRERVFPFIMRELPDVLCFQEVFEMDLKQLEALGYSCEFLPMTLRLIDGAYHTEGSALCSRTEIQNVQATYYRGADHETVLFDVHDKYRTVRNGIIAGDIVYNNHLCRIATTHFTWIPHGAIPTDEQIVDMDIFLSHIKQMGPHIMCGDFNIPRAHNFLYNRLAERYTDTIPSSYTASLDRTLHRLGSTPEKEFIFDSYMVDYIFTQPPYRAYDVRLEFGISDHAGVIAMLEKIV